MPLNEALKKILNTRFEEMTAYEEETLAGNDSEILHSMRVASRRVQAVLKTFREAFPEKSFKKEYANIQTIKNTLGGVRNCDVFIEKLEKYLTVSLNNDKRALNLLIAKQKVIRNQKRNLLKRTINMLNRQNYKNHFISFIEKDLK